MLHRFFLTVFSCLNRRGQGFLTGVKYRVIFDNGLWLPPPKLREKTRHEYGLNHIQRRVFLASLINLKKIYNGERENRENSEFDNHFPVREYPKEHLRAVVRDRH